MAHDLTLGVEEEFFLVDPGTRGLVVDGADVADRLLVEEDDEQKGGYTHELRPSMIEGRTNVCQSLGEVRAELLELRRGLLDAADRAGLWVIAAGSAPLADWHEQPITDAVRYRLMAELAQQLASEMVICGCHVHVGIPSGDVGMRAHNLLRPWLPTILALTTSSPFWMGADTGYASYRSIVWDRWPSAGMPGSFASEAHYRQTVQALIDSGTIMDEKQIYWDVRLHHRFPTIEIRIADACTTLDETVTYAALCRALVGTSLDVAVLERPVEPPAQELLRAGKWRAARYGLDGELFDPLSRQLLPAAALVGRLLDYLRPNLEETGDWDEVEGLVERRLRDGTSARRQRMAFERAGQLEAVVDRLVAETRSGISGAT